MTPCSLGAFVYLCAVCVVDDLLAYIILLMEKKYSSEYISEQLMTLLGPEAGSFVAWYYA
jgi:hypothetical protein